MVVSTETPSRTAVALHPLPRCTVTSPQRLQRPAEQLGRPPADVAVAGAVEAVAAHVVFLVPLASARRSGRRAAASSGGTRCRTPRRAPGRAAPPGRPRCRRGWPGMCSGASSASSCSAGQHRRRRRRPRRRTAGRRARPGARRPATPARSSSVTAEQVRDDAAVRAVRPSGLVCVAPPRSMHDSPRRRRPARPGPVTVARPVAGSSSANFTDELPELSTRTEPRPRPPVGLRPGGRSRRAPSPGCQAGPRGARRHSAACSASRCSHQAFSVAGARRRPAGVVEASMTRW